MLVTKDLKDELGTKVRLVCSEEHIREPYKLFFHNDGSVSKNEKYKEVCKIKNAVKIGYSSNINIVQDIYGDGKMIEYLESLGYSIEHGIVKMDPKFINHNEGYGKISFILYQWEMLIDFININSVDPTYILAYTPELNYGVSSFDATTEEWAGPMNLVINI